MVKEGGEPDEVIIEEHVSNIPLIRQMTEKQRLESNRQKTQKMIAESKYSFNFEAAPTRSDPGHDLN